MGLHFVRATAIVCIAASVCGCADLEVFRITETGPKPPLVGKIPYFLARAAITVVGTLTIKDCVEELLPDGRTSAKMTLDGSFVPTATSEPDPKYQFYISYEKSRSIFKEINFAVDTYPSRTLQSFNSTINDQGGAIGIAGALALVQLAGAANIPGVHALSSGSKAVSPLMTLAPDQEPKKVDICLPEIKKGIAQLKQDELALKSANALPDPEKRVKAVAKAQAAIAGTIKHYKMSHAVSYKWIPDPATATVVSTTDGYHTVTDAKWDLGEVVSKWLAKDGKDWFKSAVHDKDKDDWESARHPVTLSLSIDRLSLGNNSPDQVVEGKTLEQILKEPGGLVIREPAVGMLQICGHECAALDKMSIDGSAEYAPRLGLALPQFGRILILPQHSILFENSTLTVKLGADGTISSIGYRSASTAAAGLTSLGGVGAAAAGAETAHNTGMSAQNSAKTAQAQYANTVNKALSDCLATYALLVKQGVTPPMQCQ